MTLKKLLFQLLSTFCKSCNGSGKQLNDIFKQNGATNQTIGGDLPCRICDGTGKR